MTGRSRSRDDKYGKRHKSRVHEDFEDKTARKMAKREKREAASSWTAVEHLGYTDTDNPYGDPKLSEKFVWHKKMEKHKMDKPDDFHSVDARLELEKLKIRRIEREREREEREREREFLNRHKELEYYDEWAHQEDKFHLKQVTLRSRIRIQDGRAKPIDLLARYIFAYDRLAFRCHFGDESEDGGPSESKSAPSALSTSQNAFFERDFEEDTMATMDNPIYYLDDLCVRDLEDLLADIDVYGELDRQGSHADYWADVKVLARELLACIVDCETGEDAPRSDIRMESANSLKRMSINRAVAGDILKVLKSKTYAQLDAMESSIRRKIESNAPNVDIGYWESLLGLVTIFKAKARLTGVHAEFTRLKFDRLREEHSKRFGLKDEVGNAGEVSDEIAIEMYRKGRYSPEYLEKVDIGVYVLGEDEDAEKLRLNRCQVLGSGFVGLDAEDAFERRAREGISGYVGNDDQSTEDSSIVVEEVPVEFRYLWSDKYRPRKPRFFNKVHTGYDWNQYNKKHYDTDNPPPKTVQGYKFNIFYPDLIDKSEAPTYDVKICEDCRDFAVLRFHASPPYEDIAFKIVNKEWDFSHKHGFRCQFQNGIFQLWFHFRKWKYRR